MDERSIVIIGDSLERNAKKIAVGLEYSLLYGISLDMLNAVERP